MMLSPAIAACLNRYDFLLEEFNSKGFSKHLLEKTRSQLSEVVNGVTYLKEEAFMPTGLALGCEFPFGFKNLLFDVVKYISGQLIKNGFMPLALVPPDFYHVTIVNFTHFTHTDDVRKMPYTDIQKAEVLIRKLNIGPINIQFKGLIITHSGALIVPGFPSCDDFFFLRNKIAQEIPSLKTNLPNTAHIKLGHFQQIDCSKKLPNDFWRWILDFGLSINERIEFVDIFSYAQRISLRVE